MLEVGNVAWKGFRAVCGMENDIFLVKVIKDPDEYVVSKVDERFERAPRDVEPSGLKAGFPLILPSADIPGERLDEVSVGASEAVDGLFGVTYPEALDDELWRISSWTTLNLSSLSMARK